MKKKKILAAALAAAMVLAMPLTVSANWQQDTTGNWSWTEDGTKATGWKLVGSTWYYFNADGVMQTGWQKLNGNWFFLKSSGAMATGWEKVDGKWYFMKDWGGMTTGWVKTGGKWYHMDGSGAMQTGKVEVNGATYFLDAANGAMKTGFITEGDKTYFSSDYGVQTGVVEVNGKTYYFDEEDGGAMVTGSATIDGKTYNFDEDGVCTSRTKPVADATFETAGDGSIVTPSTPDDGGNTGGDTGDTGSTGGDTGSTGGGSTTTPTLNIIELSFDEPDVDGGAGTANTNIGKYTVTNNNNTVTVTATQQLMSHAAQHGPQSDGNWVGVKIKSSVPVAQLSYCNVTSGGGFVSLSDEPTVDDDYTFVYWFDASVVVDGSRVIKLAARDHVEAEIKVNFVGLESELVPVSLGDEAAGGPSGAYGAIAALAGAPSYDYFKDIQVTLEGNTIKLSGTVDYATRFTGFNQAVAEEQEGNYVGFALMKPADVSDRSEAVATLKGGNADKALDLVNGDAVVCILVSDTSTNTIEIDWDGSGAVYSKTVYTVDYSGLTLTPKPAAPVTPPVGE